MVTKAKKGAGRKKNVKVLNLKKETVKNLRSDEAKQVKGGFVVEHTKTLKCTRPG